MSVKIMGAVFDLDLPPDHRFLLIALADHADHDGENAYPGVPTLARKTGYSPRKVQYILANLRKAGFIVPVESLQGGRGALTVYNIHLDGKGANYAPFSAPEKGAKPKRAQTERAQGGAQKGAKPARAYKEEPSLTVHEELSPSGEPPRAAHAGVREGAFEREEPGITSPLPKSPKAPKHPAVEAFRRVTGRYPLKVLDDRIIDALGDRFDEPMLKESFLSWVQRGHNPQNLDWLFDWYLAGYNPEQELAKNGRVDTGRGLVPYAAPRESRSTENLRKYAEWRNTLTAEDDLRFGCVEPKRPRYDGFA